MTDRPRAARASTGRPTTALPALVLFLGLLVALAPAPSAAQQTYRWVDPQGNVRYSGFPPPPDVVADAPAALPGPAARLGPEPVREKPASAGEMLDLSGLRARLPGLVREVVTHLVSSQVELGERERNTVRRAAERAFDPARVYALLRDEYERHSAPERRGAAAAWLRSPAGRRIVTIQLESAQKADATALAAFRAALQRRPPTPGRLELIERLDWVTGSSELSADLVLAVHRGLTLGLARFLPPEQRLRPGQLDTDAQERRPELVAAIREPMRVRLLYSFRGLTDDDVRQYVAFEGSPEARAHNRALHRALVHALATTAERTGTDLARTLPARPGAATGPSR